MEFADQGQVVRDEIREIGCSCVLIHKMRQKDSIFMKVRFGGIDFFVGLFFIFVMLNISVWIIYFV